MNKIKDDILSYNEMCAAEGKQGMQQGMSFRTSAPYSIFLMSQRSNAPYSDKVYDDGVTIEYEGHDVSRQGYQHNPKDENQPAKLPSGSLTQNGLFIKAIEEYKNGKQKVELVKAYEKIMDGVWSLKGYFELIDYKVVNDGKRNVFRFILKLSEKINLNFEETDKQINHSRLIPSEVKKEVWKRDGGKCVLCDDTKNLHFDHNLPFSLGGTSITAKNIRLLCMRHNLEKSDKIDHL